MALLRPLLLDNVPSIQQSAALALGRLANYSDELAEAVVSNEILPQLVYSLSEQNVSYDFQNLKFKYYQLLKLGSLIVFYLTLKLYINFYYQYRDSTKKPLLTFLDQLPSIHHILLRLSLTQELLMPLSIALKNLTHQSKKLPLLLFHALPNIITSSLKLSLMLVPLDS